MKFTLVALLVSLAICTAAQGQDQTGRLNVAFVVWDGMELIESMGPAHVFAFAPGMDEFTVSATTDPIKSEFVTITPQYTFDNCPRPDVIVIPGGGIWVPFNGEPYRKWLTRHVPDATLTLSVCNSAILLADLGLLDGKAATCGDANLDDLMLRGRNVRAYINRRWVHDGNVITSESYLGGLDAAIYAIGQLRGEDGRQQVLQWSNYEADPHRFDALHAEAGIIPVSRRREVMAVLLRDGVDAAVERFRAWEQSGEPAYSPPLDQFDERDMFQWMAWGSQQASEFDQAVSICEFKTRVWPDSPRERAYLGEALLKGGSLEQARDSLLQSLEMEPDCRPALVWSAALLARREHVANEQSQAIRTILRSQASASSAVIGEQNEPGEPLQLTGTVLDPAGQPVAGARVDVYQADRDGNYTTTNPLDEPNARLFAFLQSGDDGRFSVRTVRPGYNPGTEKLPGHIHVNVQADGFEPRRVQLFFRDDPRVTDDEVQEMIARRGYLVLELAPGSDQPATARFEVVLQPAESHD